ncbi:MAG: choice-of-anchor D domain-containing protein [Pseudomonadota bacterium]
MRIGQDLKLYILILCLFLVAPAASYAQSAFDDPSAPAASGGGGASGLVAIQPQVDGGPVTIGSSSQVVMLFRNDGIKPVNVGAINMFPSSGISGTVSLNKCAEEPLEQGAICAIAFSIKGLKIGPYRLGMLINHDGRSKLLEAIITGNVESTGDDVGDLVNDIDPVPDEITFASVSSSRPQVRSIVLRNVTSTPINIEEIFIEASPQSGFVLTDDCEKLEAGQACLASVTWTPAQEGEDSGVLVLRHDGPTRISSVPISGDFQPETGAQAEVFPSAVPGKGLLVSSQTEVDFGGGVDTKSSITVSLVNIGDEPLTINSMVLSNDDTGINIASTGCMAGTLLEPVEACAMTVEWEPVREGSVVDDIQIYHTGARGILVLPLRGEASGVVNKDTQSIVLNASMSEEGLLRSIPQISASEVGANDTDRTEVEVSRAVQQQSIDLSGVLDGFQVTSLAPNRGIITGPGGSRVVFGGEETVIGGVLWDVDVRSSSISFSNGDQRVLLLFDKSLSSVNRVSGQSTESTADNTE